MSREKGNVNMDQKVLQDIIAQLDNSMELGTGHINVFVQDAGVGVDEKEVETMGCADCSKNPMACAVPTVELPDDYK